MDNDFRNALVRDLFTEECEVIGPENVDAILSGQYRPVHAEHGENLAVVEFVGIVVSAVGFIDASMSVYERFRNRQAPGGGPEDFLAHLRDELKIPEEIDDERVEAILRRITSR